MSGLESGDRLFLCTGTTDATATLLEGASDRRAQATCAASDKSAFA